MKASALIKELQELIDEYGDLKCLKAEYEGEFDVNGGISYRPSKEEAKKIDALDYDGPYYKNPVFVIN